MLFQPKLKSKIFFGLAMLSYFISHLKKKVYLICLIKSDTYMQYRIAEILRVLRVSQI